MKTKYLLAAAVIGLATLLTAYAHAQAPSFQWARRVASTTNTDDELSIGLAIDSAANVYVTGWFDGTNDFGGIILTNKDGGGQDIFVAKYNSSGALQWARRAGSDAPPGTGTHDEGRDAGRGIGVDGAGNVYVTGGFFGNADFDAFSVTALTNREFFLAKYDRFGAVQWVRQSVGGNGMYGLGWNDGVYGTGLAVDAAGNCYAVGFAANVTAFGTPIMFEATRLDNTNTDGGSTFLVKYDSTGAVQWTESLTSTNESYATKVAVDALGNVYLKGGFRGGMRIGATNLVSISDEDMFIAKIDASGALIWVRQEAGSGGEGGVAVDQGGNVYVTGAFGSSPLNLGGIILTNAGLWDAFVAKYSSSGAIQWARRAGGTNFDFYWDAALDQQGNIHVGGVLSPDAVAPSGSGAMVAKYDPAGMLQWAASASGPLGNPVASISAKCAVDSSGNSYLAGWYQTPTTFGDTMLQPAGYWNYFLTKVGFTPLSRLNGCDDFNDNWKDTSRWGPVFTQGCCGLLTETNGRLEFTKSSGTSSALVVQPWILNFGSYTQDWEVQMDVSVPYLDFPESVFGLGVAKGIDRDFSNRLSIDLFQSTSEIDRLKFVMRVAVNSPNDTRAAEVATTSTFAGLRIAFDASNKVLSAFYDEDGPVGGYSWALLGSTNISTAWNMTSTNVFSVFVGGRAEADVVTSTDNLFGDNFCASSGPRLWINRVGSNVVLSWSTNGPLYHLQSASTLMLPISWQPVTNALGIVNTNYTVTNTVLRDKAFYRLSP